jgi:hypothetical protein
MLLAIPAIWFQSNEVDKIWELIKQEKFLEILSLVKENQQKIAFSTGLALLCSGLAYLQLPMKLFVGWMPIIGRFDTFFAKSFIAGGLATLIFAISNDEEFKKK